MNLFIVIRYYFSVISFVSVFLFATVGVVQADSAGYLFTTPAERIILDDIRRNPKKKYTSSKKAASAVSVSGESIVGVVIRHDRKNTKWLIGEKKTKINKHNLGVIIRNGSKKNSAHPSSKRRSNQQTAGQ